MSSSHDLRQFAGPRQFETTHWSVVLAARGAAGSPEARAAVAELCRTYWYPVYAFIRSKHAADRAADLTQEFFARMIERQSFGKADPQKGRFRSWLLAAVKHFLANDWHRSTAGLRDFRKEVHFDALSAEQRYLIEPGHHADPERLFARGYALSFLQHVLSQLRSSAEKRGKGELFERLSGCLTGRGHDDPSYEQIAATFDTSANAIKQEVFRLRQRYGAIFYRSLCALVERPEDVQDEIRFILEALDEPEPERAR